MKFRMYGNTVELYKHELSYIEKVGEEETLHIEGCISLEHKDTLEATLTARGIDFTTVEVVQPQFNWLNGKEFQGGYDEALMASKMGQEAWDNYCFEHDENAQLRSKNEQLEIALAESFEKQEKDKTDLQLVIAQIIENGGMA